jgi:magnesium chelatase family protein
MCSPGMVQKYLNRISRPLLDRIDNHIEVTPVNYEACVIVIGESLVPSQT